MPLTIRSPSLLPAALLAAGVLASACRVAAPPRAPTAPATAAVPDTLLHDADGRYRLGRPFQDFYDTAFVLTETGKITPRVVSVDELADLLQGYDVVFYGESHGHAGVQLQETRLLRALYDRSPKWVLSLEQFERDVQGVLDDYLAGRIGERTLIEKGRAWTGYAASYRPLVQFAQMHHLPVIAAEAPTWAVECVGQWGTGILDEFTPAERGELAADLHVTPGAYRDKFLAFMRGSPTHEGGAAAAPAPAPAPDAEARAGRSFAAQVVRDDTMAESIARALRKYPRYQVLQVLGSFHAEGFLGTVERLRLRDPQLRIAVIDALEVSDPRAPGFTADQARDGTALQLVYPTPDDFVEGEDPSAWMAKMMRKRASDKCKYSLPVTPTPVSR